MTITEINESYKGLRLKALEKVFVDLIKEGSYDLLPSQVRKSDLFKSVKA